MDVVVEGRCFVAGELLETALGIENGRIVAIGPSLRGDRHYRFGSKLILPAATDLHVHFREPGLTEKGDIASESAAAAIGGVTCVFDMPNTKPPTSTPSAAAEKLQRAQRASWIDFGCWGLLAPASDLAGIRELVVGYKLYCASTTGDLLVRDPAQASELLRKAKQQGKLVAAHAEAEDLHTQAEERSLEDHWKSRPNRSEATAVQRLVETDGRGGLHLCHLSAQESLKKLRGQAELTSEVTPSHLLLSAGSDLGGFGKVNPPLRSKADCAAFLAALADGTIPIVASDHAPHTMAEKQQEFDRVPAGLPGVETLVPLLLQLVKNRKLSLARAVEAFAEQPAMLVGLRKGRLEVGYQADLIVVDSKRSVKIRASELHAKCGWTPFEGREAIFPEATFLRGVPIAEQRELAGPRLGQALRFPPGGPAPLGAPR